MRPRACGSALFLVAAAFVALHAGSASAEKRIALLIGNASYESLRDLKNPAHDSEDLASALSDLGFEVAERINLGQTEMREAIDQFARQAATAELAVLYYAGHGLQMSSRNYLVPVDAALESEETVQTQTIDLESVLDSLGDGPGAKIVFLDACRDNPVPGEAQGLAPPTLPPDFLVAYSAAPGQVAFDGGGRNSPFATAVLQYLPNKGQDIASLLMATRRDVMLATGTKQLPTDWSTLSQQVVLAPGEAEAYPAETRLWQLAAGGPDRDLLQVYLERFPGGPHVSDVRSLLTELGEADGDAAVRSSEHDPAQVEELLWNLARNERLQPLVELYLARYPDGARKADAEALLGSLTAMAEASPDLQCQQHATHPNDATASMAGVPGSEVARNRDRAVEVCRAAVAAFPENPHFKALLARAIAAGRPSGEPIPGEALRLYQEAADSGDARAMVSLGLLKQTGNGVPPDLAGAFDLYEKASELGHPDGKIQLAYLYSAGKGVKRSYNRAIELYKEAADSGSGMAAFNLGALYSEDIGGGPSAAFPMFTRAIELGFTPAYLAAATLLDEGRGVPKDPGAAADYLLNGVATDSGEAFNSIYKEAATWRVDTVKAVQTRLQSAGYYTAGIDGKSGPRFGAALNQWRLLGPPPSG